MQLRLFTGRYVFAHFASLSWDYNAGDVIESKEQLAELLNNDRTDYLEYIVGDKSHRQSETLLFFFYSLCFGFGVGGRFVACDAFFE